MRARVLLAAVAVLATTACAPKRPAVAPPAQAYPGFETPAVPAELAARAPAAARRHAEAWQVLQTGDARAARARFAEVLVQAPEFYPSQAALGFVELASKDERRAAERFAAALERSPAYVPALLGQAEALDRLGQDVEAVGALEAAAAADPARMDIRQRLEAARLTLVETETSRARRLAADGKLADARRAYERALTVSPGSVFLRRELASVDLRLNDLDRALAEASEAVRLDPSDSQAYVVQADVLEALRRWAEAAAALRTAGRLGAVEAGARATALEERAALEALPEAYQAIPEAPRVTRAELAALVAVRLPGLVALPGQEGGRLATDLGTHWARNWVLAVVQAGLMDVYPNHTFQPGQAVTRGEMASVVSRVLATAAARLPGSARPWTTARQSFGDIGPGHLAYPAASVAVAAGVMAADPGGSFSPARLVTGREASEAITRLERMVGRTPKNERLQR
jgi:tetratricopeptide (TPR) repeat protein